MEALLICPAERLEVNALSETAPLVNLRVFGKPLAHHWLEHFASRGAKEIKILASDRPEQVRNIIGNGARWGLRVEIIPESRELNCDEAAKKYYKSETSSNAPELVALMDHLPGFPEYKFFESYAGFFSALQFCFSQSPARTRVGVKEIKPGVWVGMRTQISPRAKLVAPCWIGENVLIKPDAVIGPMAILENGVAVENAATIYDSWVGPQTFAGSLIQMKDSLALGNTLVNFQSNSVAKIPDEFLLCALEHRPRRLRTGNIFGRLCALFVIAFTSPFALFAILKAKLQGHRVLRPRRAIAPQADFSEDPPTITYYEFANVSGWWRRWPQLWNVAKGDFTWIGNRPLTPVEAGKLSNEFERLWLAAPIGLISQGDAEGCAELSSDEARAHASFYAAQANRRLDCRIFFRALKRLFTANPAVVTSNGETERVLSTARVVIR